MNDFDVDREFVWCFEHIKTGKKSCPLQGMLFCLQKISGGQGNVVEM
jgi:hypothetical protein